jgi:hypothetical protein
VAMSQALSVASRPLRGVSVAGTAGRSYIIQSQWETGVELARHFRHAE